MHVSTYNGAKEYLESFIRPVLFQKITVKDGSQSDPLERMRVLLKLLDNPQTTFPSIVVSGTSGKGSTAYMISHILSTAGYKTGLSVSPHLQKITERMQINGKNLDDDTFISLVNTIIPVVETMKALPVGVPSYFEILLAIAFLTFAKEQVDIAVVEVGIEGKYDATNVLSPLSFVLTNISLDHTKILGETVEAIAREATAAIRYHSKPISVISGVKQQEVIAIVSEKCQQTGNILQLLGDAFSINNLRSSGAGSKFDFISHEGVRLNSLFLSLLGSYQVENASLAVQTSLSLEERGFPVQEQDIRQALSTAFVPGRFEVLEYKGKTVILDGAHNEEKMKAFIGALQEFYPERKKLFVLSFKEDKDIPAMLRIIKQSAEKFIITAFSQPTDLSIKVAADPNKLGELILSLDHQMKEKIMVTQTTTVAMEAIEKEASEYLVVITGSLYLVGEVRSVLE